MFFIFIFLFENIDAIDRLKSFFLLDFDQVGADFNQLYRLRRWAAGLSIFFENPFWGSELGSYPYLAVKYGIYFESSQQYTHNEYVRLLAEYGLVGITIFIVLIRAIIKTISWSHNSRINYFWGIIFIGWLTGNFFLNSLIYNYITYFLIAIIQVSHYKEKQLFDTKNIIASD